MNVGQIVTPKVNGYTCILVEKSNRNVLTLWIEWHGEEVWQLFYA